MNDEATTTYYEEINQMTQGALFIEQQLGWYFFSKHSNLQRNRSLFHLAR